MEKLYFDPSVFENKTVVFCIPGRSFSNKFLIAWTNLLLECAKYKIKWCFMNRYTSNVYYVRNACLGGNVLSGKKQKPFQGNVDYDYIMWIDSDIVFTPDQFFYMLYQMEEKPHMTVLSGMYLMENNTHYPIVLDMNFEYFKKYGTFEFLSKTDSKCDSADFLQADYTGFGFILIKKGVFEKLKYPWFSPITLNVNGTDIQDFCSEDVSFCIKIAKQNVKLYIATAVKVKHEKMVCL